jgi:hypothetical protein
VLKAFKLIPSKGVWNSFPDASIATLEKQSAFNKSRAPTPRAFFQFPLPVFASQSTAPKHTAWILPEKMLSVEPPNQSPNWTCFHTPNSSPFLGKEMQLPLSPCENPSAAWSVS